jgi:hypothetical protein
MTGDHRLGGGATVAQHIEGALTVLACELRSHWFGSPYCGCVWPNQRPLHQSRRASSGNTIRIADESTQASYRGVIRDAGQDRGQGQYLGQAVCGRVEFAASP